MKGNEGEAKGNTGRQRKYKGKQRGTKELRMDYQGNINEEQKGIGRLCLKEINQIG